MNIDNIVAFATGVLIPVIMLLFGKEAVGKMLLSKQQREDTALSALISIVQEAIAGWRESNVAVIQMSESIRDYSEQYAKHSVQSSDERKDLGAVMQSMNVRLDNFDIKLGMLVKVLASTEAKHE